MEYHKLVPETINAIINIVIDARFKEHVNMLKGEKM